MIRTIESEAAGNVAALLSRIRASDDAANIEFAGDVYALARRVGLESADQRDRQMCVEYLLENCAQPENELR